MAPIAAFNDSAVVLTTVFLFGLAFASFLNVCIYRLPRGLSVVRPASACPQCGASIRAYDNIPVLSWLLLGGKCRACRTPIPPRYWIVELLTAGLFVLSFYQFGPTWMAVKFCAFSFLVVGLIFTDADLKLLPDALTLPGLALGVALSLVVPVDATFARFYDGISVPFSSAIAWRFFSLFEASMGAITGAFFIWFIGEVYKRVRGIEGMGFGDVKLMAMVGAFLGVRLTVLTLMLGSVAGAIAGAVAIFIVYRKRVARRRAAGELDSASPRAWASARLILRHFEMPFGVFLGGAALCSAYFGARLADWYLGLF